MRPRHRRGRGGDRDARREVLRRCPRLEPEEDRRPGRGSQTAECTVRPVRLAVWWRPARLCLLSLRRYVECSFLLALVATEPHGSPARRLGTGKSRLRKINLSGRFRALGGEGGDGESCWRTRFVPIVHVMVGAPIQDDRLIGLWSSNAGYAVTAVGYDARVAPWGSPVSRSSSGEWKRSMPIRSKTFTFSALDC